MALIIAVRSSVAAGQFTHGSSYSLSGSGFGVGPTTLLDDHGQAGAGVLDSQWTGGSNMVASDSYSGSNIQNRALSFDPNSSGVGVPHNNITSKIAGCHYGDIILDSPWTVYTSLKINTPPTNPYVLWARWYERMDPSCDLSFINGSPGGNCKNFGWSAIGGGIKTDSWVFATLLGTGVTFDNTTSTYSCQIAQNGSILEAGSNVFSTAGELNQFKAANGWKPVEVEILMDSRLASAGSIGYIQRTINGTDLFTSAGHNYTGQRTDSTTAGARYLTIGNGSYFTGYGDSTHSPTASKNWGHLADVRVLISPGGVSAGAKCPRLIFGDQTTLAASTIRADAAITSWADGLINFNFRKDRFSSGQLAYGHVVTLSGNVLNNKINGAVS